MLPAVLYDIIFEYIDIKYSFYLMKLQEHKLTRQILLLENEKKMLVIRYKATEIYKSICKEKQDAYILCFDYTDELYNMFNGKYAFKTHALTPIDANCSIKYPGTLADFKHMDINIKIPSRFTRYFAGFGLDLRNSLLKYHNVNYSYNKKSRRYVQFVYITLRYLHIVF